MSDEPDFMREIDRDKARRQLPQRPYRRPPRGGPSPDSVAAEHEDIFQWERERDEEEGLGWGGGEY